MKNQFTTEPILLLDSHHGVYIPKLFAEELIKGVYKVKNREAILKPLAELGNPENQFYWEEWENLLDNCVLLDSKGNEYTLWQNEDLWAIPEGYENEDFFNN